MGASVRFGVGAGTRLRPGFDSGLGSSFGSGKERRGRSWGSGSCASAVRRTDPSVGMRCSKTSCAAQGESAIPKTAPPATEELSAVCLLYVVTTSTTDGSGTARAWGGCCPSPAAAWPTAPSPPAAVGGSAAPPASSCPSSAAESQPSVCSPQPAEHSGVQSTDVTGCACRASPSARQIHGPPPDPQRRSASAC